MSNLNDIESNYNAVWKEILEKEDGSIDMEQLKKELFDFSNMIGRMSSLTSIVTGGILSYPTYPLAAIVKQMKIYEDDKEAQQKENDREDGVCSLCNREF